MPKWFITTKKTIGVIIFLAGAGVTLLTKDIGEAIFGKADGSAFLVMFSGFAICWLGTIVFQFDIEKLKRKWIGRGSKMPRGTPGDVTCTIWHIHGTSDHHMNVLASQNTWKVHYNAFAVTKPVPAKGKAAKSSVTCPYCGSTVTLLVGSDATYKRRSRFATVFLVLPVSLFAIAYAPLLIHWPGGVLRYLQIVGLIAIANLLFDVFIGVFIARGIEGDQIRLIGQKHELNAVNRLMNPPSQPVSVEL